MPSSRKSVILIYLVGGPPHQDMFDLKPDAPQEIAGPWRPTATNVTGIQICEAFPRLAQIMDKLVIVRSLVGNQADHDAIQVFNGHHPRKADCRRAVGRSSARSSPSLQGPVDRGDAAVHQPVLHLHARPLQRARPRLPRHSMTPFRPMGPSRDDMVLHGVTVRSPRRPQAPCCAASTACAATSMPPARCSGMDHFTEQAFGLLTSSRLAEALDLSREDQRTIDRYGTGNPKVFMDGNGARASRRACSWPAA